MSPEQFTGGTLTRRSDLWSLALVLFELLTGVTAIEASTLNDLTEAIVRGQMPLPSAKLAELAPLDEFFRRAFSRQPDERHPDASTFLSELEQAIAAVGPPVSFAPTAAMRRAEAATISLQAAAAATPEPARSARAMAETLDPSATLPPPAKASGKPGALLGVLAALAGVALVVVRLAVDERVSSKQPTSASAERAQAPAAPLVDPVVTESTGEPTRTASATSSAAPLPSASSTAEPRKQWPRVGGSSSIPTAATPRVTSDPRWGVPVSKP